MQLRRFNPEGLEQFRLYMATLNAERTTPVPAQADLLLNVALTEPVAPATDVPAEPFRDRFALAGYLDRLLTPLALAAAFDDAGLWAWLGLRFIDQLAPVKRDGTRSPGEEARWIVKADDRRRYYRQLLVGPSIVYQAHRDEPESVIGLLSDKVNIGTSEVFRSFIENPSLIRSRSAVAVATALYYDPVTRKTRAGAGSGGKREKPGTCHRLISVLQQFDCTYDLYNLKPASLLTMLPSEFDPFKPHVGGAAPV